MDLDVLQCHCSRLVVLLEVELEFSTLQQISVRTVLIRLGILVVFYTLRTSELHLGHLLISVKLATSRRQAGCIAQQLPTRTVVHLQGR